MTALLAKAQASAPQAINRETEGLFLDTPCIILSEQV